MEVCFGRRFCRRGNGLSFRDGGKVTWSNCMVHMLIKSMTYIKEFHIVM